MIRNEKTRQLIIEKTASIFNKKGYVGTYLSDLTNATGLTKGSIYGNFKDKNEVAVEAFRHNYKFQTAQIQAVLQQEQRADKKLFAYLNHYKNRYDEIFENGGCAILNTAVDADDGNEQLRGEVIDKIHRWTNTIAEILNTGIEQGEISNIDTTKFAHSMIAMIEGSVLLAKILKTPQILLDNFELIEDKIRAITI
ncbi:MAG: TetR/AcrR family transcriptional regulator [Chitinophagales bacterium]|nr:TetR/AcrR family transcriptional regulator [Chitinophagales bacterium]